MVRRVLATIAAATIMSVGGCISLSDSSLLSTGAPFVMRGTAVILESGGTTGLFGLGAEPGETCPAWLGENGVTYHLFQDPLLDNNSYDRITTPGVTSRLVLVPRGDLDLPCATGTIVEVEQVLEIVE